MIAEYLTRRCTQRQFLLKPSKEVNRAFLFCLAFAAQATGVRWENFWAANEQPSYVELADADAALASTLYAIVNPVVAGLVGSSDKWPGLCLWQPGTYEVERPKAYFEETVYRTTVQEPARGINGNLREARRSWKLAPGLNGWHFPVQRRNVGVRQEEWSYPDALFAMRTRGGGTDG